MSTVKSGTPAAAKPGTPAIQGFRSTPTRRTCGDRREHRGRFVRRCISSSSNYWTELGVDLGVEGIFYDAGNLKFSLRDAFGCIEHEVGKLLDLGYRPILLGGDHSITLPIVSAVGKRIPNLTIIHFDAHPDLYDELEGNRMSHACPFARIMEEKYATRLIQVGIRALTGHQREQAARFGAEVIEMRALPAIDRMAVEGPVYISFDMDVLDPAFAPGLSHREPGGMSVRDAIKHLTCDQGKDCWRGYCGV